MRKQWISSLIGVMRVGLLNFNSWFTLEFEILAFKALHLPKQMIRKTISRVMTSRITKSILSLIVSLISSFD